MKNTLPTSSYTDDALLELIQGGRSSAPPNRVAEVDDLDLTAVLVDDPVEISQRYALTPTKARRLWAVGQIHKRLVNRPPPKRSPLRQPDQVAQIMAPRLAGYEVETFWVLALDTRSQLMGLPIKLSSGDVDGTEAGPRSFMRHVIRRGATSCIAVHNHPTGISDPSPADLAVTRRLVKAGRTLDIELVDHVIIGANRWTSLRRMNPEVFVP